MARAVEPTSPERRAEKVSVSLPAELSEEVRRRVGARGFSRFVAAAVRRQIERDDLDVLLAEMEATNGPVPSALLAEVDRLWPHDAAGRA